MSHWNPSQLRRILENSGDPLEVLPDFNFIAGDGISVNVSRNSITNAIDVEFINIGAGTGGIPDNDYGDVTVSGTGSVITINNNVVSFGKIQQINTGLMLGNVSGSLANVSALTPTEIRTLLSVYTQAEVDTALGDKVDLTAVPEIARDTLGTALVAGTNITIVPNDVGNTITINSTAGGGGGVDENFVIAMAAAL